MSFIMSCLTECQVTLHSITLHFITLLLHAIIWDQRSKSGPLIRITNTLIRVNRRSDQLYVGRNFKMNKNWTPICTFVGMLAILARTFGDDSSVPRLLILKPSLKKWTYCTIWCCLQKSVPVYVKIQ